MTMLAEVVDVVIGGDTHRDSHALEMITPVGVTLSQRTISNTDQGFGEAIIWIADTLAAARAAGRVSGTRAVVGLEGTRSYGIGLARALAAAGLQVLEVERPQRTARRRGKSDPIDAHLAAVQILQMPADRLRVPRADGNREALRILLSARAEMTVTKTKQANRLRALLLAGDDTDRELARHTLPETTLAAIARRRGRAGDTVEQAVRREETRRLSLAIITAIRELTANKGKLAELVTATAPRLLEHYGVGPVSAAQAIVTWSHHGRCRNDAAFAALAGANPIPASSGRTIRHRLNHGGDRQLNRALHDIAIVRWRSDPRTHAYITRRRASGKTDREIRRCLKRYIARELFRTLQTSPVAA